MPRYQDEAMFFDVPRDWQDRTIVAYAAPPLPGRERTSNLVMTREELREDETLASYVDRQVEQLAQRMEGFELIERESRQVADRPAVCVRIRSGNESDKFEQHLAMVEMPRRVVASFTMTVPDDDAAQMAPLFDRILSTVRLGARPPESPS